jgi:hypothetical protein
MLCDTIINDNNEMERVVNAKDSEWGDGKLDLGCGVKQRTHITFWKFGTIFEQ